MSDFGFGRAHAPQVVVHRFGSANAKIEQRFLLGTGAKRFTVRRRAINEPERTALKNFWESKLGPYGAFTYPVPDEDGSGFTNFICRFAREPLSWEHLSNTVSSLGVVLIEVPTTGPTYTLTETQTRFPSTALQTSLLDQAQELIPMVKIQPREAGYPAIFVSDRRCTIGSQLYQARLLRWGGISQFINGQSDEGQFVFGNADRVMRDLVNDTNLDRAEVSFSLFWINPATGTDGIQIDLWKGNLNGWQGDAGPEFPVSAADGIYELQLPYPPRLITRTCWKDFDDGAACPFSTQGQLNPVYSDGQQHFPLADAGSCDKGYDTPNGCLAHGMRLFHGGILAEPQAVRIKAEGGERITSTSILSESIYTKALQEIYTDGYFPVKADIAAGRDEGEFYDALGIVGAGPLGAYGSGHTLDQQHHHGYPDPNIGLRQVIGTDPATDGFDWFSLGQAGPHANTPAWRQVLSGGRSYKDNFAADVAFIELRRFDEKGLQLTRLLEHEMEVIVQQGLKGFIWTDSGDHVNFTRSVGLLTNGFWIVVNALLRAKGLQFASAAEQLNHFDVKALADSTLVTGFPKGAALIADLLVPPLVPRYADVLVPPEYDDEGNLIGGSYFEQELITEETQFKFRGVIAEQKPLRDWIQEILMNCLGYYTFANGKLRMGIRVNSSVEQAFTEGNIIFDSLQLRPQRPAFNDLRVNFADEEFDFVTNSANLYDIDHAKFMGSSTAPLHLKSEINLAGTASKSQAHRILITRLREELGGITAAHWRDARESRFQSTVLALATEAGMVCSLTHSDMPNGSGEFRIQGWRLNQDYSIEILGRTTVDEMYDYTVGPKPADVTADPLPFEAGAQLLPPPQWNLTANLGGDLRLAVAIPVGADYRFGDLTVLADEENERVLTTLAAGMNQTDTQITVTSSAGFLVGDYFHIGEEIIQISGPGMIPAPPASNVWDVARAQKGTMAGFAISGERLTLLRSIPFHFSLPPGWALAHPTIDLANGPYYIRKFRPGRMRIMYAQLQFSGTGGFSPPVEQTYAVFGAFEPFVFGTQPGLRVAEGGYAIIDVVGDAHVADPAAEPLRLPAASGTIGLVLVTMSDDAGEPGGEPQGADLTGELKIDGVPFGIPFTVPDGATGTGIFMSGSEFGNVSGKNILLKINQVGSTSAGRNLKVTVTL